MARFRIISPVKIDGEIHKPGHDDLELEPEKAAPAVVSGSLVPVNEISVNRPTIEAERLALIRTAIGKLEPGKKTHWTADGRPEVAALKKVGGLEEISAEERDVAWEMIQAGVGE